MTAHQKSEDILGPRGSFETKLEQSHDRAIDLEIGDNDADFAGSCHGSAWNSIVGPLDPTSSKLHVLLVIFRVHCNSEPNTRSPPGAARAEVHVSWIHETSCSCAWVLAGPDGMALGAHSIWEWTIHWTLRNDYILSAKTTSRRTYCSNLVIERANIPELWLSAISELGHPDHDHSPPLPSMIISCVSAARSTQEAFDSRPTRDVHKVSFITINLDQTTSPVQFSILSLPPIEASSQFPPPVKSSKGHDLSIGSGNMNRDRDSDLATTRYHFVFSTDQPGVRSHAMRQFWRRRHEALQSVAQIPRTQPRTLLPIYYGAHSRGCQQNGPEAQSLDAQECEGESGFLYVMIPASDVDVRHRQHYSIVQGPRPKFPIDLSTQDQETFSSWLDLHASFGPKLSHSTGFDPVRDVWLPLDLSNSASFCALMAHAAAHVAHLQGQANTIQSEKFRMLAVGIIAKWLADERSTQDETIFGDCTSFDKYWVIDDYWRAHENGLVGVINARGGVESFRSSWRLHMALFLAFSLPEPSRRSSAAHVWEISEYFYPAAVHPAMELRLNQYKPRTFRSLQIYPDIHETVMFLAMPADVSTDASPSIQDHALLSLFILSVIVQESLYSLCPDFGHSFPDKLTVLNEALCKSKDTWRGCSQKLYEFLMENHFILRLSPSALSFIIKVAQNLIYLNEEARAAIKKCLLNRLLWDSGHAILDIQG
ncbi:hypothetical protein BDQ94DRAFT_177396 [Aspergillus welwitschiae]|uniref:Transcription factor domain-containing protein n=1 Tax=Aspergillus welwitschiae TaxID=1341132 RepID=A0A3F3PI11_9EURO|nr:hypothetical protein BDQ94DRAFT_177396 [Aspergillus welwitschiae]RDH26601.1 hypothetical protein BDQ94DRAFT_177396 [Aspergillus welwitschiae]